MPFRRLMCLFLHCHPLLNPARKTHFPYFLGDPGIFVSAVQQAAHLHNMWVEEHNIQGTQGQQYSMTVALNHTFSHRV